MCYKMFSAPLLLSDSLESNEIDRIFDDLGPTPRLCFDLLSDLEQLEKYKRDLKSAISNITVDQLINLAEEAASLRMDAVSDKIYLVRRERRDVVDSKAVVAPITNSIQSRLANQLQNVETSVLIRLYKEISGTVF